MGTAGAAALAAPEQAASGVGAAAGACLQLPFPAWADPEVEALCKECWSLRPSERPTAQQVRNSPTAYATQTQAQVSKLQGST